MKKLFYIMRILIIALWPILFLLIVAPIERHFSNLANQTYQMSYLLYPAIIYTFSGCLFAICGLYRKEDSGRKSFVNSHIVAGTAVLVFVTIWLINFFTGFVSSIAIGVHHQLIQLNWNTIALVFGYTMFVAIRTIAISREKK